MKVFEAAITNYCNFKCDYCISDKSRGSDKFSEPIKVGSDGKLLLHDKELRVDEVEKREKMLVEHGQAALDEYISNEHAKWVETKHLKHDYTDWLDLSSLVDFVKSRLSSDWIVNLTGGEPLYHPEIEEFVGELCRTHIVLLTTNASMVKSKKKFNDIDRSRIVFRVGFHPEFRNLDRFVESINYLIENNFKYIINYVVHPRNYENGSTVYADHIESLERNNFKYELTPYEGEYDGVKYPRKLYDRSEIETALFSAADVHRQKTSVMGSSFMMCEPDGKIYECQGKHVTLGDVYSKSVMLQKVHHVMCFVEKGCYTSRSANTYLSNFFDEKLG